MAVCQTVEEVIEEMTRRWRRLHRAGDWRAVFAKTYLRTTEEVLLATRRAGLFENPAWVVELDCEFASRYFDAVDRFSAGEACPWPWRLAFRAAVSKRTFVSQDVLLGMNAHINYDLPHSLHATIPAGATQDELDGYRRDNLVLNRVLAQSIDVVQEEVASEYDLLLSAADAALHKRDEAFASQLIKAWRARAWGNLLLLRSTTEPALPAKLIEESATDNALLLLQAQRAFPAVYWPNRVYRDSFAWLTRRRQRST